MAREGVHNLLGANGYHLSIVQNSTTSLANNVAATKAVVDAQDGPVVLVGNSYGGAVISEGWQRSESLASRLYRSSHRTTANPSGT